MKVGDHVTILPSLFSNDRIQGDAVVLQVDGDDCLVTVTGMCGWNEIWFHSQRIEEATDEGPQ